MPNPSPTDFYKTVFQSAGPEQREAFLQQLFAKDASLRAQFENFIASWSTEKEPGQAPTLSFVDLEELQEEVRDVLSEMDFSFDDVYRYFDQGDRSYVPDYEAAWEGAENMLREEVFEAYGNQAQDYLRKGNLLDGVKVLLALYEGSNNVYEPGSDETYTYDDGGYNDALKKLFREQLQYALPLMAGAIKTTAAVAQVFGLIVDRVKFWEEQYDESLRENEWRDNNVVYDLKVFEPLFITLLDSAETASYLEKLLLEHNLKRQDTSIIFLKIANLKGDESAWEKAAEAFCEKDESIMQQLLEHYRQKGREKELYRIAKKAFRHFPHSMHGKLLELIEAEKDEAFYVKVLAYHTQITRSIKHYRILQQYLSSEERSTFIKKQKSWMDFYAALLAEEQRHEEILEIIKKHRTHADSWGSTEGNFYNLIQHILDVYPGEAFDLIRQRVDKALEGGRGRHIYATVTTWLQRMLQIKGYEEQARSYIKELVNRHNNLRALKDEMRKGGVL